jgi:hypothetical protein
MSIFGNMTSFDASTLDARDGDPLAPVTNVALNEILNATGGYRVFPH